MRFIFSVCISCLLVFVACKSENNSSTETTNSVVKKDTILEYKNDLNFGRLPGIVGVFDVPAMLALYKADSCELKNLSKKLAQIYGQLQHEAERNGVEVNGPLGQIKFNNNPDNFKFACFLLMKQTPANLPLFGNEVILKGGKMLVYNHFGPAENLHISYQVIKNFLTEKKLNVTSAMREFYVVPPSQENKSNCITVILVPVS